MLIIVIVYILRRIFGCTDGFFDALDFWTCTDSGHYLDIARDWYLSEGSVDRLVQLVFLPGYPVVVRLVTAVTGDGLIAGLIVSALCFAGANVMLYKLVSLDCGHETALRAVKFLSLSPAVFFFAAPMSESLFCCVRSAACTSCGGAKCCLLVCSAHMQRLHARLAWYL